MQPLTQPNIRPAGDKLIVLPDQPVTMKNGIAIPPQPVNTGLVISLSPDFDFPFEVGHRIMYNQGGGFAISLNDREFLVLRNDEVILKFEE
jgi:co-chaperonin GroES (HSP10)